MIASQCADAQRLKIADDIILNENDPAGINHRVEQLHAFYQNLAASRF